MPASSQVNAHIARLHTIVKTNDVRGIVDEQLTSEIVAALAVGFAEFSAGEHSQVVVARDMRESSEPFAAIMIDTLTSAGLDVIDIGLASTDMLYFASGSLNAPGVVFTASHNPAEYNGMKLCLPGAVPIGLANGLDRIRDTAESHLRSPRIWRHDRGVVTERPMLADYVAHLHSLVDLSTIRPLKVAVDAGNGMAGMTIPAAFTGVPVELVPLYFDLDGTFPNHPANPLNPDNLLDLQRLVRDSGADIGLAFDGDADRCFVIDERGEAVSPSAITALVALRELQRYPGATVLYNAITSRIVPELVSAAGGTALRTKVGHSFIKMTMAETGAIFAGEHSGHYYFKDFFNADTGLLAAFHVLAALAETSSPMSELIERYRRYAASGEINRVVSDIEGALAAVQNWATSRELVIDGLDGITVTLPDGSWANVRVSNTEPLLRLNVEAVTQASMGQLRDELLGLIGGEPRA